MSKTPEKWKTALGKQIKEMEATRDRQIENIGKESKKKASETDKTKDERKADLRAEVEKRIADTRQALREEDAARQPSTAR